MDLTAKLAGYFAAHAVWCVSDGETLVPLIAFEVTEGNVQMERLVDGELQDAVRHGKERLANNPQSAIRAVLIYDGFVTLSSGKTDALLVEAVNYGSSRQGFTMAVAYRPTNAPNGFAVYRPKFLGFEGSEPDWKAIGEAFFNGVNNHEKGAAVWNKYLDQSR